MAGLHVTDRQVRRFMTSRREGHTQAVAAAQAGFSERTARRIEAGPSLPSQKPPRTYRTRAVITQARDGGVQAPMVLRMVPNELAPVRRAVSTTVRMAASPSAAHMAR